MSNATIFKSPEGEATMGHWYDRFAAELDFHFDTQRIETSFGHSEVIVCGPSSGPPVVLFHGAMAGAPHALREMADLPKRYRTYAVNVIGQSVRAAPTRPDSQGFARWTTEVFDALHLSRAVLLGVSWGGYVALRAATVMPERLLGLILVCPAALVRGPVFSPLLRFTWPLTLYRLFGSEARLHQALGEVFTTVEDLWTPFLGDAIRHVKLDFSVPPLCTEADLAGLEAPVLVFAADQDLMFPGEQVLRRAAILFENLDEGILIENCRHAPAFDDSFRGPFAHRVGTFLEGIRGTR